MCALTRLFGWYGQLHTRRIQVLLFVRCTFWHLDETIVTDSEGFITIVIVTIIITIAIVTLFCVTTLRIHFIIFIVSIIIGVTATTTTIAVVVVRAHRCITGTGRGRRWTGHGRIIVTTTTEESTHHGRCRIHRGRVHAVIHDRSHGII